MKRLFVILAALIFTVAVHADTPTGGLDTPTKLLERAAIDKNHLRDVLFDLEINITQLRDQATFEQYFFLLDALQVQADRLGLNSIYPDAVKKLGAKMVEKGVNWLNIISTPQDNLLYYHRWMGDPQVAASFLNTVGLRVKGQTRMDNLKVAASNLEAVMLLANSKWPQELSLKLNYRSTLSELASRALKAQTNDNDPDTDFWLNKIYTSDVLSDYTTYLQTQVYALTSANVANLHAILKRLVVVYKHAADPAFAATESLASQIGDTGVDLVLKSFRLEERLSDAEFEQVLSILQTRHLIALASAWTSFGRIPRGDFAGYYLDRAYRFVQILREKNLTADAIALSDSIDKKAAAIVGHKYDIEGTWEMRDNQGARFRLVIAYGAEDTIFASFEDTDERDVRPLFVFVYDPRRNGFIAAERPSEVDKSPNRPIRIFPQADGSLTVFDLETPLKPGMKARRVQKFPDLFALAAPNGPVMDGTYQGTIQIPAGKVTSVSLVITVFGGKSIANLQMLEGFYNSSLNFGSPADNGVVYLTHTNVVGSGTWIQLRGHLGADGYLRGYAIYGGSGLVNYKFALKKLN